MKREHGVYIVISQTGTILSTWLKNITGASYNHVSISLRRDLGRMYSFGRRHPYNPWWGGFVLESTRCGTMKRFVETECVVLYKPVTPEQYSEIKRLLRDMYCRKEEHGYNAWGLILAAVGVVHKSKHGRYYCSEFVRDVLIQFGVEEAKQFPAIVKPMDLLNLRDSHIIYRGKLHDYTRTLREKKHGC